ncbi:MAG: flavodoxin family protein [Gammaproteobacteria bacterium]|jgi:multimeric flavodoxin WrbA|nr:flavodoxin family protein [Gammaproteobacteria bacterium]
MQKLLIVSHSPSANAKALTDAVVSGASNKEIDNVEIRERPPLQADSNDVLWADGVILGTTENFGYMSGAMKDFFDRIYYPCLEHTEGLPFVLFVKGGIDGQGAKNSVERIVTGLKWRQVQPTLVCKGEFKQDFLDDCENLGMTMAAGLEAGIF